MSATPSTAVILITHAFPYGTGEAFLESEIGYLTDHFDRVMVLTKNDSPGKLRFAAPNFSSSVTPVKNSWLQIARAAVRMVLHGRRSTRYFIDGARELRERDALRLTTVQALLHDLLKAHVMAREITRLVSAVPGNPTFWLYSYWLTSSALAILFTRPGNMKIVRFSRAHRADLYPEQSMNLLTFRRVLANDLGRIYAVSQDGVVALRNIVGDSGRDKIELSRLGTHEPENTPARRDGDPFLIISCSYLAPVKRVHLIIEALSLLAVPFRWIHFGDGPMRKSLEDIAVRKLASKSYEFRGQVDNHEILAFYRQHFVDVFLNTSSSEGIPVSIMEAQSFSIPCIAMDVGGVREIVPEETGLLLNQHTAPAGIADVVARHLSLPVTERDQIRRKTHTAWDQHYNAKKNFPFFIRQIKSIRS